MVRSTRIILTGLSVLFFALRCSSGPQPTVQRLSFALIGNTHPESPFQRLDESIKQGFQEINRENPLFVVHLGNMVHGGYNLLGVSPSDIERQYHQFNRLVSSLHPLLFTVKGETDVLKSDPEMYQRSTRRAPYFSFNYGPLHLIVLDTSDPLPGSVGPAQMAWLRRDLEDHTNQALVVVFSHHPLIPVPRHYGDTPVTIVAASNEMHTLFMRHRVKVVFSGNASKQYSISKDGIEYLIAGFPTITPYARQMTYYLVTYNDGIFSTSMKKITLKAP